MFSDFYEQGKSSVRIVRITDEYLRFVYRLDEEHDFPYAGLNILFSDNLDLSNYDYMKIAISSTSSKALTFTIRAETDKYDNYRNALDYFHYECEIPVWQGKKEYIIQLSDISVPDWWYISKNLSQYEIELPGFAEVEGVALGNNDLTRHNTDDFITLRKLSFHKKPL